MTEMNEQVFELFRDRFNKIDADNDRIFHAIENHVREDDLVHAKVERHELYFKAAAVPALGTLAMIGQWLKTKLGF